VFKRKNNKCRKAEKESLYGAAMSQLKSKKLNKKELEKVGDSPVFECLKYPDRGTHSVGFFCPFCKEKHFHGTGGDEALQISHRNAHCRPGVTQTQGGYWIFWNEPGKANGKRTTGSI